MLTQVVESREPARAVAFEGSFTRVFSVTCQYTTPYQTRAICLPDVPGQMLAASEAEVAWREVGAVESLALLLLP